MEKTTVRIEKHVLYTKISRTFEVNNDLPIPDLIEMLKRDYPGFAIVSIETVSKLDTKYSKARTYSYVIISDGKRLLSKVKNGLLHLIGGGSLGNETARMTANREFNEEITMCDSDWHPEFLYLDSRLAFHSGMQQLENFLLVKVAPGEMDYLLRKNGCNLLHIPHDLDYLNSLNIGVECDDSYYYGMLKTIQYYSEVFGKGVK